ncbi:UDP pyrophosphate synthase [Burkholderia ubonensis]|uniref:polyprenyl diphosphate synthase n=1 Tax=Burkholderia ubonensis TaxID=101571 RepID=UPI000751C1EC|nr:polyprenyl diphosphate synthase [Burkholderia ubonensis]KVR28546.1 UDP pyrophosphate synthase [Burkholderia ubonensis]
MVLSLNTFEQKAQVEPQRIVTAPEWQAGIKHLAVILDGNRRWAVRHGLPLIDGYRAGGKNVHALLDWCEQAAISLVTVWPLSIENLGRPPAQVNDLLSVIATVVRELADSGRWNLKIIGDLGALPSAVSETIQEDEQRTHHVEGMRVNLAIAYSGRRELLRAMQELLIEHVTLGTVDQLIASLNDKLISNHLYTAGQPDPDLVIRTSGEQRLSNFMPWQTIFSEFYFTPVCWPEFTRYDFEQALDTYRDRHRRFGE